MVDEPVEPAQAAERPRGRVERRRAELNDLGGADAVAMYFKERVYGVRARSTSRLWA